MNYHRVTAIAFVVLMLLSATAATIGFSTGTASAATSGDWQYEPVTGTNGVRITGYTGPGGVVTVPSDIEGKSVTTIGFAAFRHINSITSVTIPNSVTTMGESAFAFCTGLTSVYIGSGIASISDSAFRGCTALAYVEIPNTVTGIGDYAFYGCTALTSITIPSSVNRIGVGAFWNAANLVTMIFNGNAPIVGSNWANNHNSGLVAYYKDEATGFSNPWSGVQTSKLGTTATAPNNLTATSSTGKITLTWDAPTHTGGSDIDDYVVYKDGIESAIVTSTTATLTELTNGRLYSFYVMARSDAVNSQYSNVIAAIPLGVAIKSPSTDGTYNTTGSVTIAWTEGVSSEADGTEVSIDGGAWIRVLGTSYRFTSLSDGSHVVHVRVTSSVGNTETVSRTFIVDTVAPTITDMSPTGTNAAINSTISVTFSEAMDEDSVSIDVNGISGMISWSGNTATLTLSSSLAYDAECIVTVTGSDIAGNALETTWTFATLKNEGTISGVIKDKDGNPVADAKVKLNNSMSTKTDANGYFELTNVPSGSYTLTVDKNGYEIVKRTVSVTAGGTSEIGVLELQAAPGDDSLFIAVVVVVAIAAVMTLLFVFLKRRNAGGDE